MFKKKSSKPLPHEPVDYPVGTCVKAPSGTFFINKDGKKYKIISDNILNSYAFPRVIETSDVAISKFPTAVTNLGFRDGALLRDISSGKIYFVSGSKARPVVGLKTLSALGLVPENAVWVSRAEIATLKQGDDLP